MNPEEIRSMKEISFSWDRLQPDPQFDMGPDPDSYRSEMPADRYDEARKKHDEAASAAIFKLLRIDWDTCECEPPCNCNPYVSGIQWYTSNNEHVQGVDVEVFGAGEREEVSIMYNNKHVVLPIGKGCSMQDFYNACVYLELPLFFRERWQHLDRSNTVIGVVSKMIGANTPKGVRMFANNLNAVNVLKKVARVTLDIETETGYDLTRMMAGGSIYYTLFFVIDKEEYDAITDQS